MTIMLLVAVLLNFALAANGVSIDSNCVFQLHHQNSLAYLGLWRTPMDPQCLDLCIVSKASNSTLEKLSFLRSSIGQLFAHSEEQILVGKLKARTHIIAFVDYKNGSAHSKNWPSVSIDFFSGGSVRFRRSDIPRKRWFALARFRGLQPAYGIVPSSETQLQNLKRFRIKATMLGNSTDKDCRVE